MSGDQHYSKPWACFNASVDVFEHCRKSKQRGVSEQLLLESMRATFIYPIIVNHLSKVVLQM